jgi:hypothetical protein
MIARMCRRIVAILLIFGWVSLSGFDVLEDLGGVSGHRKLSSPSQSASGAKTHKSYPLANNIVESADLIHRTLSTLVGFAPVSFACDTLLGFRRHSQLHKLYRVFLI